MKQQEQKFLAGAAEKGYSEADARAIFELILPFAGYAFNKAHSVSYGIIAYQTAYLKANFPEEYLTAVLMMAGTHERIAEAYGECVRLKIPVLQPDINASEVNFSLQTGEDGAKAIRYGLSRVKNVGEGSCEGIVAARRDGGPFKSLDDFFERVDGKSLNKRGLECLAKAGAFDGFAERAALLASLDRMVTFAQSAQRQREAGQTSLFDLLDDAEPALKGPQLEDVPEATKQQRLTWEKELLGIYLSEHPFARASEELSALLDCNLVALTAEFAGGDVIIGGVVTGIRTLMTKDGRSFIAATLEDQTGGVEVTVWPETLEATRDLWVDGQVLIISARVKQRDDRLSVAVNRAAPYIEGSPFDPSSVLPDLSAPQTPDYQRYGRGRRKGGGRSNGGNGAKGSENGNGKSPPPAQLKIVIDETDDADGDAERLRALIAAVRESSGTQTARLSVRQRDGEEVALELPAVSPSPELTRRLSEIIGPWGAVYG
jgi:DNA polymerase-3 subunit alpha